MHCYLHKMIKTLHILKRDDSFAKMLRQDFHQTQVLQIRHTLKIDEMTKRSLTVKEHLESTSQKSITSIIV